MSKPPKSTYYLSINSLYAVRYKLYGVHSAPGFGHIIKSMMINWTGNSKRLLHHAHNGERWTVPYLVIVVRIMSEKKIASINVERVYWHDNIRNGFVVYGFLQFSSVCVCVCVFHVRLLFGGRVYYNMCTRNELGNHISWDFVSNFKWGTKIVRCASTQHTKKSLLRC